MRAKSRSRRPKRNGPHPIDIHVARRVRERRIELGLTQPQVAAELGITFQHLYKFEKAKSRISASRHNLAIALAGMGRLDEAEPGCSICPRNMNGWPTR